MSLVIDASVFVAASRTAEQQYAASLRFLTDVQQSDESLYSPVIVLAECSGAIARATRDASVAQQFASRVESFPGLRLASVTLAVARRAAQLAGTYRLRGADSLYVAVASEFGATLITWDHEMLQRVAEVVTTATPAKWIEDQLQDPPAH